MNCDWTEKISLLIDGELAGDESARAAVHLTECAACRLAKEDFLALREAVVGSYPLASDAAARTAALERILASGTPASDFGLKEMRAAERAPRTNRFALFGPRLTPAFASAFALAVLAVALGLLLSVGRRGAGPREVVENNPSAGTSAGSQTAQQSVAPQAGGRVVENSPAGSASSDSGGGGVEVAGVRPSRGAVKTVVRRAPSREQRTGTVVAAVAESAKVKVESDASRRRAGALEDYETLLAGGNGLNVASLKVAGAPVGRGRDAARHFEQAQVLLRSFRVASVEGRQAVIADERQRSQKLLYRNMILRREAGLAGNIPVERALDSLEPLLIDIANLPARPGREDVRAIRERMERKNIVAVLEANLAAAPRAY